MSIKENIKIANPAITDEEIKIVIQKAYAWDFV
jgi:ABC-type transport system involved in cytochrome bd biosynthesis fused ATPase/permease subunit